MTTSAGTWPRLTSSPLSSPKPMPSTAASATTTGFPPSWRYTPAAKAEMPSVEPTDRSTLRVMTTRAWPVATRTRMVAFSSRSLMPCSDRNSLLPAWVTAIITRKTSRMASSRTLNTRSTSRVPLDFGTSTTGLAPTTVMRPSPWLRPSRFPRWRRCGGSLRLCPWHHQHAVGHAEDLGQVGGDLDQHGDTVGGEWESSRCTSALVPTSMPRVGVDQHLGSGGEPLGEDDLLLVAAREGVDGVGDRCT
ncbi:hypothetical protein SHIRM173S_04239 [Streptomyces hirsutus]